MECINYDENSRSGGVAAVSNGSFLVCKPYIHYRTFVCTTELKRRAANYSETGVGVGGGMEIFSRRVFYCAVGCVHLALQTTCYSTQTVLECCERDKPFLLCLSAVLSKFFTAQIKRTKHAFVMATL